MGLGRNDEEKTVEGNNAEGNKGLIDNKEEVRIGESKYVADPNGDTKIELEVPPAFSGLNKEELMKYSNDPFWVRLRWVLFILFWVGWAVMLVMAIVIIVQTPGCKPPPTSLWIEKQTAIEFDPGSLPTSGEVLSKAEAVGVESVYLPNLVGSTDFSPENVFAKSFVSEIVDKISVITDLPSRVDSSNSLFSEASANNLLGPDFSWNYNNEDLAAIVFEDVLLPLEEQGIRGFLMQVGGDPEKMKFKDELNRIAAENGSSIAVGGDIVDTANEFSSSLSFQQFLENNADSMKFYRFNPNVAIGSSISSEDMRLVTMGLFMFPGAVVLKEFGVDDPTAALLSNLVPYKKLKAVMFGHVNFANTTSGVVAFTRTYKGSPAYAVALNFNDVEEDVSFEGTDHIGDVGTTEIVSGRGENDFSTREKYNLKQFTLKPYEGVIIQFVGAF